MSSKTSPAESTAAATPARRKRIKVQSAGLPMPNAAKAPAKTFKVLPARLNKASQGLPEVSTTSIHTATENSKQARLIKLLKARTGTTITQMMQLTGWQAHTVRGMISRTLRKRLHLNVVCDPATVSGVRRY